MSLKSWNPFNDAGGLRKNKSQSLEHSPFSMDGGAGNPRVDIYHTSNEVIVKAEVHGISKEDIDVYVDEKSVRLSGKSQKHYEAKDKYRNHGQQYNNFSRTIQLPSEIEIDHARAEIRDGILSITAPKVQPSGQINAGMDVEE